MTLEPELLQALGLALTGEPLGPVPEVPEPVSPVPELVEGWFTAHGWPVERLRELRAQRQADGLPWPFPVEAAIVRPIGFARFLAVLKAARAELGLDGLVPTVHHGPKVIGPAEQRLLADVPPHHGNVG